MQGNWVSGRLIKDAQNILPILEQIRADLMEGKALYTYIAKTSDGSPSSG
jgi:hypothetical protein